MKIGWGIASMVISWVGLLQANGNELMVLQAKKPVVIKQQKKLMYYFTNSYTWRVAVSPTTYLT